MHAGTTIPSHRADSPISLQVIEGVLKFSADAQTVTLGQGQLLTLHAGMPHVVEAVEESAFLLTVATEHSILQNLSPKPRYPGADKSSLFVSPLGNLA
jgi:quercetin dioxygenase-like cupin family protein